jgi:hypothetical protein
MNKLVDFGILGSQISLERNPRESRGKPVKVILRKKSSIEFASGHNGIDPNNISTAYSNLLFCKQENVSIY